MFFCLCSCFLSTVFLTWELVGKNSFVRIIFKLISWFFFQVWNQIKKIQKKKFFYRWNRIHFFPTKFYTWRKSIFLTVSHVGWKQNYCLYLLDFFFFSHMEKNRRNLFNLWNRVFDIYSFFSFIKMKERKSKKEDSYIKKKTSWNWIFFHIWKRNSTVKQFKNIFIFRQNVFILRFAHVKKNPSKNNTFNLWNSV